MSDFSLGDSSVVFLPTGAGVYSDWTDRIADNVICTLDVVEVSGMTLTVKLFSKNRDEVGDGTEVDSTRKITATTIGRKTQEWGSDTGTGLKELVRVKAVTTSVAFSPSISFRMLGNCWFDSVRAPGLS
jgi:hypothetical protein